jgi:hypothetical protein
VRLGAPVRGVVYGLAVVMAVPLAWSAGNKLAAILIGGVALFGIGLEALVIWRKGRDG